MFEPPLPADATGRRGRWFRIRLDDDLCCELEYAAHQRRLTPERLLTVLDQVILRERLVDAVLDDAYERDSR